MSKLDILVAEKVMGYYSETFGTSVLGEAIQVPIWMFGEKCIPKSEFNPSTCLDDALLCLERAIGERGFNIQRWTGRSVGTDDLYQVWMNNSPDTSAADSLPIAMCLCALRASGVPESLITQAIGEGND